MCDKNQISGMGWNGDKDTKFMMNFNFEKKKNVGY